MCLAGDETDICQDIYLFALTVRKLRKQHRQWLLLCEADWLCVVWEAFSSLVGYCVNSFQAPNEKDH